MKGFEFLANLDYSLLACSQLTTLKIMARTLLDGKDKELIQAGLRKKKIHWLKKIQMSGSKGLSHVIWCALPIFGSVPEFSDRFFLQMMGPL